MLVARKVNRDALFTPESGRGNNEGRRRQDEGGRTKGNRQPLAQASPPVTSWKLQNWMFRGLYSYLRVQLDLQL